MFDEISVKHGVSETNKINYNIVSPTWLESLVYSVNTLADLTDYSLLRYFTV